MNNAFPWQGQVVGRGLALSFISITALMSALTVQAQSALAPTSPSSFSNAINTDIVDEEITVVITAGRREQAVGDTIAPVTTINRETIERLKPTSVPELLQQTVGLTVVTAGGLGKQTSIHLRGTNTNHVLVLVDGVKMASATTGAAALELLPLEHIERIEIVRGPRSSFYGAEAIGGVIQIFTRRDPVAKGFQPSAALSYGTNNTFKADANLALGSQQGAWLNVGASTLRTNGIDTCSSTTAACFADEPDKDGYQNQSLSLNSGYRLNNGGSIAFNALQASGETEFDGGFQDEADFKQQILGAKVTTPWGDKMRLTAQIAQSQDETDNFKQGTYVNTFNTQRRQAGVQADINWAQAGNLTLGFDYLRDQVDSSSAYTETSRDNDALFASYQRKAGANQFEISVRRDNNEQFGKHVTGGVGVARELGAGMRATASYGTGFKAPTFNDLYFPFGGNPDLEPETSRNLEVGLAGRLGQGTWSANLFQNKIDQLIAWQESQTMNVNQATIQGLELAATQRVNNWRFNVNATLQQPEISSGANKGNQLINRPEHVVNLAADREFGRFTAGASVHAESTRYTNAANTDQLGGYAILDLRGSYQLSRDWFVGVKVGNVLDKQYQTSKGYKQPGINGLLSVNYRPR